MAQMGYDPDSAVLGYRTLLNQISGARQMSRPIDSELFTTALYQLLDETFDNVQGFYLDRGTSFFETLATISAADASIPVGGQCATLSAQVKHVSFYLDVIESAVRSGRFEPPDWGKIWRETKAVDGETWQTIQADLRGSYNRIKQLIADADDWSNPGQIGGAIAVVAHTAYHLGEIRQALCILQKDRDPTLIS